MSAAAPAAPGTSAQPASPTAVTNKIFVSGLGSIDQKEVRQLFSSHGEVLQVVVDRSCATVTFQEERVVQELEQMGEIMLGSMKLHIARVLEENLDTPEDEAPFYQAGVAAMPVPAPSYQQYQRTGLSSSYPTYLPAYYPVWNQQPPPSPYYDPAISDCGPVQPQTTYQSTNLYSLPPPTSNTNMKSRNNVFSFDTVVTQQTQQKYLHNPTRPDSGCCHVCSTPAVQGVAPLTGHHHHPLHYGHQLQPLTPMTPSLNTGYLLPPTPTPMDLPPMTPTYYLPPSPVPPYMMYQTPADVGALPYTSMPPTQPYTSLKPSDNGTTTQEDGNNHRQNVAYFTSPFKRFSKFRGTPTPARFPLRTAPGPQGSRGRGGQGDSSNWYQQGDRWGQRSGGEVEQEKQEGGHAPDLVRDCKGDKQAPVCKFQGHD